MKTRAFNKIRQNKTWLILCIAVSLGLVAALIARSYLVRQMADIEERGKGKVIAVVVAKTDLPKGAIVSSENLAVRRIPMDYAHSAAVSPDHFERIDGQVLAYPVKSGEMVLWGLMEPKRVPSFSARVGVGHRAITVPVDEINSISGMLEPGDVIDLMATVDQKTGMQTRKITFPLLQGVQILATGQRSVDDPHTGEKKSYSTVTLDTTPEQAQQIIVARDVGKITALLRNPQDTHPMPVAGADVAALLGMKTGKGVPVLDSGVPVLYGGSGGKLPEEGMVLGKRAGNSGDGPVSLLPWGGEGMPAAMRTTMQGAGKTADAASERH
ncbi:MAG: Flp pilus assembly protein CpaB [Rhodoferax sp.]